MTGTEEATLDSDERTAQRVRENRLRRMAERQGYRLKKSSRRDPRAIDYDCWWIEDATELGRETVGDAGGYTPDQVEEFLTGGES